eukprot:87411-Pelagomonas_calceolata.AAC.2
MGSRDSRHSLFRCAATSHLPGRHGFPGAPAARVLRRAGAREQLEAPWRSSHLGAAVWSLCTPFGGNEPSWSTELEKERPLTKEWLCHPLECPRYGVQGVIKAIGNGWGSLLAYLAFCGSTSWDSATNDKSFLEIFALLIPAVVLCNCSVHPGICALSSAGSYLVTLDA